MKKTALFCVLFSICFTLNACQDTARPDPLVWKEPINYNFVEPATFPFRVNNISSEIDVDPYLHQFVFHYKNQESTQQINYILSKGIEENEKLEESEFFQKNKLIERKLENGMKAYYDEEPTSQGIWWQAENGFVARFIYFINENKTDLGNQKLTIEELVDLANQVQ